MTESNRMQENVTLRDSPENVTTECSLLVSPVKTGVHIVGELDSRLRGNDRVKQDEEECYT